MKTFINRQKNIVEMESTIKYNKNELSHSSKDNSKLNVNMLKSVYSINDNNCEFVTLLRTNADQKEYELQSIEKQYFHKHKDKLMKHKERIGRTHSRSQERLQAKTQSIEKSKIKMMQKLEESKSKLDKYNEEIFKLVNLYKKQEEII